jgi:hypothetical protein
MDEATSAVPEGSRRPTATAAPAAQAPAPLSMGPVADTGAEQSMRRSPSPASSPSQEAFLRHKVPPCLPTYLPACLPTYLPAYLPTCLLTRPRMQSMPSLLTPLSSCQSFSFLSQIGLLEAEVASYEKMFAAQEAVLGEAARKAALRAGAVEVPSTALHSLQGKDDVLYRRNASEFAFDELLGQWRKQTHKCMVQQLLLQKEKSACEARAVVDRYR